ncbi:MAG TPA: flagellar motor protein MotB [Anaeromyxobacteraceae bacterium]|nr:flagellar motor protein MotB [Anaeromyxobacteraceae bacterium]
MLQTRRSALLCCLILATACVTESTYKKEEQKAGALQSQKEAYAQLNAALKQEVASDQVRIEQLNDRLKVTLVDEILFPEGGWEIDRKGAETLDKTVPTLKALKGQRIEVEGFTDDVPIGPDLRKRFPSNWELSAARATDVVRYLVSKGVAPQVLSAAGFGDTRPVATNDTSQGRAKNRRIEVVLRADMP